MDNRLLSAEKVAKKTIKEWHHWHENCQPMVIKAMKEYAKQVLDNYKKRVKK